MKIVFTLFSLILFFNINLYANTVVNRSLGKAGNEVITARDVEINYLMNQMLFHYKLEVKSLPLTVEQQLKELANLQLEIIVNEEAQAFNVAAVAPINVTKNREKFLQRMISSSAYSYWKALGVSSQEIQNFLSRKLRARNFIGIKRKSSEVLVSDEDVLDYYNKNKQRFGDGEYNKYKENIRSFLEKRQGEERLREWFQILKEKYKLNTFIRA